MSARHAAWPAVAIACVMACHPARTASQVDAVRAETVSDTVIGTVQIAGTEAFPRFQLIPANGDLPLQLVGPPILRRVDGLQLEVAGKRAGNQFTVASFQVVGANGQPATDGRLVQDGGTLYLVTRDGARHALVSPSPNLRAHVGGRVWVSGPLDREAIAYGIIE